MFKPLTTAASRNAAACRERVPSATRSLEVVDDGMGAAPTSGRGGHGLVGRRERVTAVGGRLDAGPGQDGGWQVRAEPQLLATPP